MEKGKKMAEFCVNENHGGICGKTGDYCNLGPCQYEDIKEYAPVRHGRWEWLGPNRLNHDCMCGTCSVCKIRSKYIINREICPNCGAKMDLEIENNEV